MPLPVKAYLSLENRSEIRRFEVEDSFIGNYAHLYQKIVMTFPELNPESIQFFWIDHEGDKVVFGSDEELKQALSKARNDGILKIYVEGICVSGSKLPSDRFNNVIHHGVSCDGCDKRISGIRFKCLQCPDYDLCVKCENKDIHKEHILARLVDPSQSTILYGMLDNMNAAGPGHCRRRKFRRFFDQQWHPRAHNQTPKNSQDQESKPTDEKSQSAGFDVQSILKNVAEAMNVFGIDLDAEIDVDGKREKVFSSTPNATPEKPKDSGEEKEKENADITDPTPLYPEIPDANTSKKPEDWCMVDDVQSAVSKSIEDQRILEIVQKLESMGFRDDDKWLTNLVKEKKADMNAILDSMHFKL